ncbi:hypothetical protein L2E82_35976 [Cichorium intybus]|uniref:Uncharacterized protein n=1 Tax=Cichorium intybus TaxID=13427 RepID=A0ACB9BQ97_CICIN|nr:hypothetical protein L2E82_35976 [Cichorium intybus]
MFTVGDKVVATSAVFGIEMWPAAEYGRTMYTIRSSVCAGVFVPSGIDRNRNRGQALCGLTEHGWRQRAYRREKERQIVSGGECSWGGGGW